MSESPPTRRRELPAQAVTNLSRTAMPGVGRAPRWLSFALLLGLAGMAHASGALRLQQAAVMDRGGFERPMVAAVAMIPVGWRTEGGVVWTPRDTCGFGYRLAWRAKAPDGSMAAAVFPGLQWGFNNFRSSIPSRCPVLRITNVREYLRHLVSLAKNGARILDFRRRPDLEQLHAQSNRVTPMPGGELRTWVEAGEVLLAYRENGREMREAAAAVVVMTLTRMAGGVGGGTLESITGVGLPGFAFSAPDGQLDLRLGEVIRASFQANPQWSARIAQHRAKITRSNVETARRISDINTRTSAEIREINRRGFEARNRTMDRLQRETTEMIRGVETFDDPDSPTGQVELSNIYQNAWRLDDGTYVVSDQPDLDAFRLYGQNATRLRRSQ